MVQTYRKKPVEIQAIQWTEENTKEAIEWIDKNGGELRLQIASSNELDNGILIKTLEGYMKISSGDYIIRGVKGEFYPCKPDIFYATYDGPVTVLWDHTTGENNLGADYCKSLPIEWSVERLTKDLDEYYKNTPQEEIDKDIAEINAMFAEIEEQIREEELFDPTITTAGTDWMDEYRGEYDRLLVSGMFFEFHPTWTGVWEEDKYAFCHREKFPKK